ncbi:MAG: hypothetical protein AB7O96_04315 [Pseudobdellovibrionaceae bacterium]
MTRSLFLTFLLFVVAACSGSNPPSPKKTGDVKLEQPPTPELPETPETPEEPETPETPELPETPQTPETPPEGDVEALPPICSKLSFSEVRWPENLSSNERIAFSLSLNISGSFEGPNGWKNISNNFDGMGLSMGLLNQTLGTGSLQPLLVAMKKQHYTIMQKQFANSRLQSLLGMLSKWEDATSRNNSVQSEDTELPLSSRLDNDWQPENELRPFNSTASPNTASVAWAVATLYTESESFKTDWKRDLQKLIKTSDYISLQVNAAQTLHKRSKKYQARLKMKSLRSYLLMFDFVVQNGGITDEEFAEWDKKIESSMTEKDKLKTLLKIRIRRVRPEYVNDVRSRKNSIIEGQGLVHGENRDYEKEYCFSANAQI